MKCDNPTCTIEVSERTARKISRFHHCSRKCRYINSGVMLGRKKVYGPNPVNAMPKSCLACNNTFMRASLRQKYCKMCVPDGFALGRMQKYGLTQPQYNAMLTQQNFTCALCPTTFVSLSRHPDVDHDHLTGRVRGLLCRACNLMMRAIDNEAWHVRAVMYASKVIS